LCAGNAWAQGQPVTNGLALWLEADAGVITDSQGFVVVWFDQSGNAHDAVQVDPSVRPFFADAALNGLPVVWFNGRSNFLELTHQVLTSQHFTILAVVDHTRDRTDIGLKE